MKFVDEYRDRAKAGPYTLEDLHQTHAELLAANGLYATLYRQQFAKVINQPDPSARAGIVS